MPERLIVLDTETTGIGYQSGHRVIEIGCVELVGRKVTGEIFHRFLNPERKVDKGAEAVHGISDQQLIGQPFFKDIAAEFLAFLGNDPLIIHNAPFDIGFLNNELDLCGRGDHKLGDHHTIIDTLVMARKSAPGKKNTLDVLCARYKVVADRKLHGALLDAGILAQVYLAMTRQQDALFSPDSAETTEWASSAPATLPDVQKPRLPLRLVRATDEELALHREYMTWLKKGT